MGKNVITSTAPLFLADDTYLDQEASKSTSKSPEIVLPETLKEDRILSDVYNPGHYDDSPCAVHDGLRLRTDCLVCKEILPEKDRPIIISKALLQKLSVTENLLKFLYIQKQTALAKPIR